jgi:hypothetical protein
VRAQRTAVGRPQILVDDDYDRLPEVDVLVRNVSQGGGQGYATHVTTPVLEMRDPAKNSGEPAPPTQKAEKLTSRLGRSQGDVLTSEGEA